MTAERIIDKKVIASAGSTEDEEIIELTEEIAAAPENDDGIIELTDEIVKTGATPAGSDAGTDDKQAGDIPDTLVTGAEAEKADAPEGDLAAFADSEIKIGDVMDDELDFDEGAQDDFVDSLGMDLETNLAIRQLPEENEVLTEPVATETAPIAVDAVSPEQIEAVIERIIMKILPEKIDSLLSAAIEKTLTKEINKIKEILLED